MFKWIKSLFTRCWHKHKTYSCGDTWTAWTCNDCGHEHTDFDQLTIWD